MAQDLGARLIRAGLLSRGQLARALVGGPVRGGALVAALIDDGLPEEALVGFFVSDANAVQATESDLESPDSALVRLVPRAMADALCALPLRRRGSDVIVALADPTDKHTQSELGRVLGATTVPVTAHLSHLRKAIERAFARIEQENASINAAIDAEELFDEPPVELVRRKVPGTSTPSPPLADDEEPHMPLVRTKPASTPTAVPRSGFGTGRERTQTQDRLGIMPDTAPKAPTDAAVRDVAPNDDLLAGDRWSSLPTESVRPRTDPAPLLTAASKLPLAARQQLAALSSAPPEAPLSDIGPALAAVRGAASRDEAVRLACEAALPACRCAVFLALKREVLQGRDVVGGGVSREAIYNLWIPVTSASVFREAIMHGAAHFGPYGTTAADGIYKAAIGATGGAALVQPVAVAGKPVAVLCADDLRYGSRGRQRIEALAHALGEAFERLIVSKKK